MLLNKSLKALDLLAGWPKNLLAGSSVVIPGRRAVLFLCLNSPSHTGEKPLARTQIMLTLSNQTCVFAAYHQPARMHPTAWEQFATRTNQTFPSQQGGLPIIRAMRWISFDACAAKEFVTAPLQYYAPTGLCGQRGRMR